MHTGEHKTPTMNELIIITTTIGHHVVGADFYSMCKISLSTSRQSVAVLKHSTLVVE